MIELRRISKVFGGISALKGVNMTVDGGGVTVIVGRSGAGKTTLLKILAMLLEPTSGRIIHDGVEMGEKEREALRKRFTMVFQRTVLFSSSVYSNVAYGLRLRGASKEATVAKVRTVLEPLGLAGLEGRLASRLSGGQQQRVSLARALVLEPEVLLMDEPTANLDPENTAIIERMIISFAKSGSVVMSTHNVAQALRLADRVVFLEAGSIIAEGGRDLLESPTDTRISRFVRGESQTLLDRV
jgi:tungstate transport system ATP-binding protein